MKIAYVTTYNAFDVRKWSGCGYYMAHALSQQGLDLGYIGDLAAPPLPWLVGKGKSAFYWLKGKKYITDRYPDLAKSYARQIQKHPLFSQADVIFSPGTIPISYLDCPQPIVFWTDATFAGMVDFYPEYTNLCAEALRNGNAMEQSALDRCQLAIYGSDWAARSAIEDFRTPSEKIKVASFGANLNIDFTPTDIETMVAARSRTTCRLLFIGLDWKRKGGDIALEIARQIHAQGVDLELTIVGSRPPGQVPDYVKLCGFLSKASHRGVDTLHKLYRQAHFLVVPSRAEASGVVFSEASGFGVPSVTTRVGGVTTTLRDGRNGMTFSPDSPIEDYVEYILRLWSHPQEYRDLALSAYEEYRTRLNWRTASGTVKSLLEEICG